MSALSPWICDEAAAQKEENYEKKVVSLLAAMALAVTALAGCGSNDAATTGTDAATVAATTEAAGTTEAATDSEAVTGVKAGFISCMMRTLLMI